jgi:hypothetical protein
MMSNGSESTPQGARLQTLHRQNISGTSVSRNPSRLSVVIGPTETPLSIRMSEPLDDVFQTLVTSRFSNVSGRKRRDSNHIRLYLTVWCSVPPEYSLLTTMDVPDASWVSLDSNGTFLFTDYVHRIRDPLLDFPVLVRSVDDLARDMTRIFSIAASLYGEVAQYHGSLYAGISLTNLWGTAVRGLEAPPERQAQVATWHTEIEFTPGRTVGNSIFHILSSLLRDLQYEQSEQPVREIPKKLGYDVQPKNQSSAPGLDDKTKERALLLMRFYWRDRIFEIGSAANIEYFSQFEDYWETDHYVAALEISKVISDDDLLRVTSENPPRYALPLGGFQGRYYSATPDGVVTLSSSREQVLANLHIALEKWGEKAYGLLEALIRLGGRAPFYDLVREIEDVLGYEFVPSYHLPRLASLQLVYKTGSNKYPDWTMPPEIVPMVEQELADYTRPARPRAPRSSPSDRVVVVEGTMEAIATEIVRKRRDINLTFLDRFRTELFRQNEMATADIRKPCSNEEDFNNRILNLTNLIDGIGANSVRGLLTGATPEPGSINILEALLQEHFPQYDRGVITSLRMTTRLRSKKYPIHADTPEFVEALRDFGSGSFPPDWQELWEAVLAEYLNTLTKLLDCIR